ncbi:hypothetical protein H6G93_35060 [Nostoc sp. FACHB-973]|nr:hypothetical protein [Nostoc sp. FACHB-973]
MSLALGVWLFIAGNYLRVVWYYDPLKGETVQSHRSREAINVSLMRVPRPQLRMLEDLPGAGYDRRLE